MDSNNQSKKKCHGERERAPRIRENLEFSLIGILIHQNKFLGMLLSTSVFPSLLGPCFSTPRWQATSFYRKTISFNTDEVYFTRLDFIQSMVDSLISTKPPRKSGFMKFHSWS